MTAIDNFNIRVYFLLCDPNSQSVMVSDELIAGKRATKFPGGGLEYGEGIIDCAKREAVEELGQEIEIIEHFYTTEFFQQSAFKSNDQIVSIYYRAKLTATPEFNMAQAGDSFAKGSKQQFRWLKLAHANTGEMTFPIDKIVLEKLKETTR